MSISLVGTSSASGSSVSIPAHQAGDFILIFAFKNNGNSGLSSPTGWTTLGNTSTTVSVMRVAFKTAASSSDTSGTWTGATEMICLVYRPSAGFTLTVGKNGFSTGSSNTVTYGSLALQDTSGASWVAAGIGHLSTDQSLSSAAPSGMTNEVDELDTAELAGYDTNGGVTSWASHTVSLSGTANWWVTVSVEIKQVAVTINNLALSVTSAASTALNNQAGIIRSISSVGATSTKNAVAALRSFAALGSVSVVNSAGKRLVAAGAGVVAQILRQWLKTVPITGNSSVALGPRLTGKAPSIGAGSVVQRTAAIAAGHGLSSAGTVAQLRQSNKSFAFAEGASVAIARLIAKARTMSSTSTTSIQAIKVKIVALFAASAGTVSSVRQSNRLLLLASASLAGTQRLISHGSGLASSSSIGVARSVSAARSVASVAVLSIGRVTARRVSIAAASAVSILRSIARTRTLTLSSTSSVILRKGVLHALQVASSSAVSAFHAAVTKVILSITAASSIALSRRPTLIRTAASAASLAAGRAVGHVVGSVSTSSLFLQRAMSRSLGLTAGARVVLGLLATVKETVNRYLKVVGRATRYLVSGQSDVLVKGAAPSIIIGSTAMNTHEPLDFLCGMDWQLGGPQLNADGTPLGLSGATVQWKLDSLDGGTNYITLTSGSSGITVDLSTSSVSIDVPGATTAGLSPGTYRDYLIVTLSTGQKIPMWTGIIRAGAQPA